MNSLVIIDGNAILHRAYHALPPLTNKDGQLTNAVYGFASILLKLLTDFKPEYLVVCFDRPEPTFRKQLYAGYQEKRPKMEDDLSGQIDLVKAMLDEMGVSQLEKAGYEADDLIGTVVSMFRRDSLTQDYTIIVVTGDRDIFQLVDKQTFVFMPSKGIADGVLYGEEEVVKKMGVKASQIVHYKALTGDASDNYPGVVGIGSKTAASLLNQYQTIDHLYSELARTPQSFSPKAQAALTAGREDAYFFLKIATIDCAVPVDVTVTATRFKYDFETMGKTLGKLGFSSLVKRVENIQKNKGIKEPINDKVQKQTDKNEQLLLI